MEIYIIFIKNIWKFISSLIGFLGIVYVVGWVTSRGYYSEFGAIWLTSSQSLIQILEFSHFPLLLFLVFLSTAITDIFGIIHIPEELFFFKHFNKIMIAIFIPTVSILIIDGNFYKFPDWVSPINILIFTWLWLTFSVQMLKQIIFMKMKKSKFLEEQFVKTTFALGLIGCFLFPYYFGVFNGKNKANFNQSRIPYVTTKASTENQQLRFLFKSETHIYAAEFIESGPPYKIKILPIDQIAYIEPFFQKLNKALQQTKSSNY